MADRGFLRWYFGTSPSCPGYELLDRRLEDCIDQAYLTRSTTCTEMNNPLNKSQLTWRFPTAHQSADNHHPFGCAEG